MIVVSDTSCISNLLTVGHADLLSQLFGEVIVPPAVEGELRRCHSQLPSFLKRVAPKDVLLLSRLSREVDAGEAEAICVTCELKADRLLIDEKQAVPSRCAKAWPLSARWACLRRPSGGVFWRPSAAGSTGWKPKLAFASASR